MSRPVSWFRWYRGKVWHVGWSDDAAACGSVLPVDAETVGERAPANARVCGDCVAAALHLYALAQAAQMGDPRSNKGANIIPAGATLPVIGDDEWPCGNCGHANLDHDCDDGTCVVTVAITGDQCPCPGLKRAG
jgi:hypothetical protein